VHECLKMMIALIDYLLHEVKGRGVPTFSVFLHEAKRDKSFEMKKSSEKRGEFSKESESFLREK
jgi:hypothetical protein